MAFREIWPRRDIQLSHEFPPTDDTPIPYVLTEQGKVYLAQLRAMEAEAEQDGAAQPGSE